MRLAVLASALLAVALPLSGTGALRAEPLEDCRLERMAERRIAACSAVIAGRGYADDQLALAYRNRGRMRLQAGALDQAIFDLGEAIRLAPLDPQTFLYRAQARVGRGDLDGAIGDYSEAVRLRPTLAIALIGRGHAQLAKGDAALAIADFSEAIRVSPANASAYNNRGLAFRASGQIDRAIEDYTKAIQINPIYGLAYNNRAYAHEAAGRKTESIADFQRALILDPSLVGAKEGLGRLGAQGDLATESARLVADGRRLVEAHCQACHAIDKGDESRNAKAPTFRSLHQRHPLQNLREPLTRGIAAPHDEMPKFRLPDGEIDKIVAYINSLVQRR